MAVAFTVRAAAEPEDQVFPALPFVSRREYDQVSAFAYPLASGGGFIAVAQLATLTTVSALVIVPDQDVTVRLAGQSDQGTLVRKGGLLLLSDCSISNAGNNGVKISNASGSTATIRGVALGS